MNRKVLVLSHRRSGPVLKRRGSGFTLLELIIVIIIVGVLTSLALPRLFSVIEGSRAAEALSNIATIRASLERCRLLNNGKFGVGNCTMGQFFGMNLLDIEDPSTAPNAHFEYNAAATSAIIDGVDRFVIRAIRTSNEASSGDVGKCIYLVYNLDTSLPVNESCPMSFTHNATTGYKWGAAKIYKGFIPKGN